MTSWLCGCKKKKSPSDSSFDIQKGKFKQKEQKNEMDDIKTLSEILQKFNDNPDQNQKLLLNQLLLQSLISESTLQSQNQSIITNHQIQTPNSSQLLIDFGRKYHSLPLQTETPLDDFKLKIQQAKTELMKIPNDSQSKIDDPQIRMAILKILLHDHVVDNPKPLIQGEVGSRYLNRITEENQLKIMPDYEILIHLMCKVGNQIYPTDSVQKGRFLLFLGNLVSRKFRKGLFIYEKQFFDEAIRILTLFKDCPLAELARVDLAIAIYRDGRVEEAMRQIEMCLDTRTWCVQTNDQITLLRNRKLIIWEAMWLENFTPVHPKILEYKREFQAYQSMPDF